MTSSPANHLSFTPDPTLLNPKFESYKLTEDAPQTATYPLPKPTLKYTSHAQQGHLSFAQVKSRVHHNHLARSSFNPIFLYIDDECTITAVELDENLKPTFHPLHKLVIPPEAREYVTIWEISTEDMWLVGDGHTNLLLFHLERYPRDGGKWSFDEPTFISIEGEGSVHIHHVAFVDESCYAYDPSSCSILFSRARKIESVEKVGAGHAAGLETKERSAISSRTVFDYSVVTMSPWPDGIECAPQFESSALPSFVHWDEDSWRYIVGASAPLKRKKSPEQDEKSTQFDSGDSANSVPAEVDETAVSDPQTKIRPAPFSWIQDKESVTLAFPIPSDTPTSSIRLTFSRQFLTLHIAPASAAFSAPSSNLPRVSHKKLWDEIDPHTSVWTFDREAEGRNSTFGLLSLHLEKAHPGTKWSDVFATSARAEGGLEKRQKIEEISEKEAEIEYEGVAETVDPSELAKIAEQMEQWTQDLSANIQAGNAEGATGVEISSSLLGEEIDAEVDAEAGSPLFVSFINNVVSEPKDENEMFDEDENYLPARPIELICPHPSVPFSLLTTSLPLGTDGPSSITIKHDVDALRYDTPYGRGDAPYTWEHRSTFPALAFILATKTDSIFVHHDGACAVLAFEGPSAANSLGLTKSAASGAGNCFIYYAPEDKKATTAKSAVIKIGEGDSGSLVGVATKSVGDRKPIVALCENQLVIFENKIPATK